MYMYVDIYVHVLYKHVYDTCRDGTRHTHVDETHTCERDTHTWKRERHTHLQDTQKSLASHLTLFHTNWRVSKKPQDLPPAVLEILASYCDTLQHTATHCDTLQHTATHCNTLQHSTTNCATEWVSRKPYQPKSSVCMCLIHMCVSVSLSFK